MQHKIMTCVCGNEARYVDESGALTCAICPIRTGVDSIKIGSVPALLFWCRQLLQDSEDIGSRLVRLREIVGRLPPDPGRT